LVRYEITVTSGLVFRPLAALLARHRTLLAMLLARALPTAKNTALSCKIYFVSTPNFSRPFGTFDAPTLSPALKRRAIIRSPFGTNLLPMLKSEGTHYNL
jgi:hypothetical protein